MVGALQRLSKKHRNIVAVVGAAHVPGIVEYFDKMEYISDERMADLNRVEKLLY